MQNAQSIAREARCVNELPNDIRIHYAYWRQFAHSSAPAASALALAKRSLHLNATYPGR